MNNFLIKFENYSSDIKNNKIFKFGEYRKGSDEYGGFINDLMLYLRNFNNSKDFLKFKTKNVKFDVDKLYKLKNDENKNRLISFNIKFTDINNKETKKPDNNGYIIFLDLNKKNNRPWESKNEKRKQNSKKYH